LRSLLLLAGILLALWIPVAHRGELAWCLAGITPVLLAIRPARRGLLAVLGAAHALLVTAPIGADIGLSPGERVIVEARVLGIAAQDDSGWQFDAEVRLPRHPGSPVQRWRVQLPGSMDRPAPGELWQYGLRFDPPRDARARRLLLRERVSAKARLVEGSFNVRIDAGSGGGLDPLRAALAGRIADRVADPSAAALLAALAVGATGDVSARQWHVFNATGITHLVAISGMHVTFFAMLCMAGGRRIWPLLAKWPGMPRRELFAAGIGICMALLYALLSGFSVPAQRTVVMLAAFLLARESGRSCTPAWSVAVALVAVLLFDPLAALSAGFWLSFLAVAAIVLVAGARLQAGAPLPAAVRLQWLVTVALLPATVAIFGSFSAVGLLANALAIPAFTLLLVPPILLATACYLLPGGVAGWCGDHLVDLAAIAAAVLWPFLSWCAGLPAALWQARAPVSWFPVAIVAALLALLPVARVLRGVALVLLVSVFLLRDPRPPRGEVWIDVPDAGRSSAVLLRTRGHMLLWGTGESFGARGRAFTRHVLPLLHFARHRRIDVWLPGTLTRDSGAALAIGSAALPALRILLPPARGIAPEFAPCASERWDWDGITFALAPADDGRSCSLAISAGEHSFRLGGKEASGLPEGSGDVLRLLLDVRGLKLRARHLQL
jgi:competence protein ComEC